jgi:hypothetical protein
MNEALEPMVISVQRISQFTCGLPAVFSIKVELIPSLWPKAWGQSGITVTFNERQLCLLAD